MLHQEAQVCPENSVTVSARVDLGRVVGGPPPVPEREVKYYK